MSETATNQRMGALRRLLREKPYLRVIETVNGLEALIAECAAYESPEGTCIAFDALWLSGLCHAAFKGQPDTGQIGMAAKLETVREIRHISHKPLLVDCDTGGTAAQFSEFAAALADCGASAAVIEDKTGVKRNSLYGTEKAQLMEDAAVFAEKIRLAKGTLKDADFMVIARVESLIAGESVEEALQRAAIYCKAGADGIVIHSIRPDAADVFAFAGTFRQQHPDVPLVMIPTAYSGFTADVLHEKGADIIIYANHLMRSAHKAMLCTAQSILREGRAAEADSRYCTDVKTILSWIDGE